MKSVISRSHLFWQSFRRSKWFRIAELAVLTFSFGLMIYSGINNLSKVNLNEIQFDLRPFLMAVILTWFAVWLGAVSWAQILKAFFPKTSITVGVRSHMLSLAIKYVPGLGWQQISKIVQLNQQGLPTEQTASAVILEFMLLVSSGLIVVFQTLALTRQNVLGVDLSATDKIVLSVFAWVMPMFISVLWLRRVADKSLKSLRIPIFIWRIALAILMQVLGWFIFGVGLWFVCLSIYSVSLSLLPHFILALICSFIIGMLVLIAPNGVGVRELAMTAFFQTFVPLPIGIVVSVMSRIVLIVAEIIGFLPFMMDKYRHKIYRA